MIPINNEIKLAEKITEVLSNKEKLKNISKNSKESMQKFTTEQNEKIWKEFILKNKREK